MQFQERGKSAALLSGFTLIEVLIALVILSVGMLGIAGLHVQSLQAGRTAVLRHNAVTLAGDIADRIRANPRAGAAYALADPGVASTCIINYVNCTRDEMAANDIFLWNQQARSTLPIVAANGDGVTVAFNNTPTPPDYQITVSWSEAGIPRSYSITIPVLGI